MKWENVSDGDEFFSDEEESVIDQNENKNENKIDTIKSIN